MNKFKLISGTSFAVLIVFSIAFFTSCEKKAIKYNDTTLVRPCENVICLNGGSCDDGLCQCPVGYEGVKCEKKWSEKFVGNYIASDECFTGAGAFYDVVINPDNVYPYKMHFFDLGVVCTATDIVADINPEKSTFMISMQNTCGDIYTSGYGNISSNGNYINVYLKHRDSVNHTSQDCSIVLNRKP